MTAVTISGLRISPYTQKDALQKLVFGDEWSITVKLPTPHETGDKYAIGLDYENTLYPPNRPLCAGSETFILDGDNLTFNLKLGTARMRDWCSKIRKPSPLAIQIVRIRNNKAETLLLDSLLALPSVFDGVVTVCEGDAIQVLLDAKLDKPAVEGVAGQVLSIDENGQVVWKDEQEIPEQVQADYDESDSTSPAYIENKPDLSVYVEKEEGKGLSTNDFTDADVSKLGGIENGAEVNVQADWDESDSTVDSYIQRKPHLATVATTGSYDDLTDKPVVEQADWDESDSTSPSYIENKPDVRKYDYLTFSRKGGYNYTIRLDKKGSPDPINLEYRIDDGEWTDYTWNGSTGYAISLINGTNETVQFRGDNDHFNKDESNYYHFDVVDETHGGSYGVQLLGSVMSLVDSKCMSTTIPSDYCFCHLFDSQNAHIDNMPELSATVLTQYCYLYMFTKSSIKKAVFKNRIEVDGYRACTFMFLGCTKLKEVVDFPFKHADQGMFNGTGLEDVVTNVYGYSVTGMSAYEGCTNLRKVNLRLNGDYGAIRYTFKGCTNLREACIEYNVAIALSSDQNQYTFQNCTNLSKLTIKTRNCIGENGYWTYVNNWLDNVSPAGIFICDDTLPMPDTRSASRIPEGWTIVRMKDNPQADWDESDSSKSSFIQNKPEIPQPIPQEQADWDESDSSDPAYILNKPVIPVQENADWDESDSSDPAYIENKPTIPTTSDINDLIADALTFHNN